MLGFLPFLRQKLLALLVFCLRIERLFYMSQRLGENVVRDTTLVEAEVFKYQSEAVISNNV